MADIKYMNIKEFRKKGFLFEANRQFFHPLGLALEINVDEEGNEHLSGVWDYREDPEGMFYGDNIMKLKETHDKVKYIEELKASKEEVRKNICGSVIQPLM